MTRKLLVLLLVVGMVFVGPRRMYGSVAEVMSIVWNKVTGSVEDLEDTAERSLRKALEAARTLAADKAAAEEAAAMARVERDQARRELEKVKSELSTNLEMARALAGALKGAGTMKRDRLSLGSTNTTGTAQTELTRTQARDVLEASRRRVEYLRERERVQGQALQRTETLASDWEKRVNRLAMATDEARQSGEILRVYRRDEQARQRESSLQGGLIAPLDPDARLEDVRRGVALEEAKRGYGATSTSTGAEAIYKKMVEERKAEQDLGGFLKELESKVN